MIFYFSGTGNSHWLASQIANATGDTLISIASQIHKQNFVFTLKPGEPIGWVFPIHSWGVPTIVLDFIAKHHLNNYTPAAYCYIAVTCGDDTGLAIEMCQKALGAIKAKAAFSLQMPNTYILLPGFDTDPKNTERQKLRQAQTKVQEIITHIKNRSQITLVTKGTLPALKTKIIYPLFKKFGRSDTPFHATTQCVACGKCVQNCPTQNIRLSQNRPQWLGHCTMCLACIHHCPTRAIQYGKTTQNKGRYHFPEH